MNYPTIAFFGTPDYSVIVLEALYKVGYPIVVVITKPDKPIGRKQSMTATATAVWAKEHNIPVLTPSAHPQIPWEFADPKAVTRQVLQYHPELLIVADYTQKIPLDLITQIKFGGLNVHPSLLPSYRGPAPIPWAIYNGETQTGVSIVTLSEQFDQGRVIAQEKAAILATDTTETLLPKLFTKGAQLLVQVLLSYVNTNDSSSTRQQFKDNAAIPSHYPRLTRQDGFEPWEKIKAAMENDSEAARIERKFRAFHPWPGLWTKVKINGKELRLKILKAHLHNHSGENGNLVLDEIQLEGGKPVTGSALMGLLGKIQN